jgi:cephalosporin hydroxylase
MGTRRTHAGCLLSGLLLALSACQKSAPPPSPTAVASCTDEAAIRRFHEIWYHSDTTWKPSTWQGIVTHQNPMDLWIIQELLFETKPDYFIECGTDNGGSAVLWATMLRQINPAARVITIDIVDKANAARQVPIAKESVEFLVGSSTAANIFEQVAARVKGKKVFVLLDSDHHRDHVLQELKLYAPLVQVGGYIVVQDTNVNGHPVVPGYGPGPWEAVDDFLRGNDAFAIDATRERFLFSFAAHGHLKRIK